MSRSRVYTEFGPLIAFFVANYFLGIMPATGVLVALTVVSVAYTWITERHIPKMLVFGAVMVSIFGGLTLVFDDAFFLKIKPTVVSLMFAVALGGAMVMRRNLLQMMLGGVLDMDEASWRKLTLYWIGLFAVMAAANELAWRNLSTDDWVTFKTFGLTALSVIGGIGAVPLMKTARDKT